MNWENSKPAYFILPINHHQPVRLWERHSWRDLLDPVAPGRALVQEDVKYAGKPVEPQELERFIRDLQKTLAALAFPTPKS